MFWKSWITPWSELYKWETFDAMTLENFTANKTIISRHTDVEFLLENQDNNITESNKQQCCTDITITGLAGLKLQLLILFCPTEMQNIYTRE